MTALVNGLLWFGMFAIPMMIAVILRRPGRKYGLDDLADWFLDKWEQRPWRAAIIWTGVMTIVLVAVVGLTDHYGWGIRPIRL